MWCLTKDLRGGLALAVQDVGRVQTLVVGRAFSLMLAMGRALTLVVERAVSLKLTIGRALSGQPRVGRGEGTVSLVLAVSWALILALPVQPVGRALSLGLMTTALPVQPVKRALSLGLITTAAQRVDDRDGLHEGRRGELRLRPTTIRAAPYFHGLDEAQMRLHEDRRGCSPCGPYGSGPASIS